MMLAFPPGRLMTPWPAVVPLPYSLVWFEPAVAHVHLSVSLEGLTPGLPEVLGVPLQLSNFEPPGVCFVCESFEALVFDAAVVWLEACSSLFAEAELPAAASSAFFACPLLSAEADAVTPALVESFAA
jgi:hypothetical protein